MKGWAVVCDFDGTATVDDIADALSVRFAGFERWERANEAFQEGRISFERLLREIFEPIVATPEQVRAFTREAKGRLHAEAIRYLMVSGTSLLWNLAAAWGLVDCLRLPPIPGVILASVAVGVAWNYPLHRLWVFRGAGAGGAAP